MTQIIFVVGLGLPRLTDEAILIAEYLAEGLLMGPEVACFKLLPQCTPLAVVDAVERDAQHITSANGESFAIIRLLT